MESVQSMVLDGQLSDLPFILDLHRLLNAGECPSNVVDCPTLQIQLTYNRLFLANPNEKYACQWSSPAPPWSSTGSHICQLDLLGIADYIVFVSWICNVCAILSLHFRAKMCEVGLI